MKRIITMIGALSALVVLAGCSHMSSGSSGASENPALMHHSDDTKGQGVFPSTRSATGNKVFVFSPRNTAWAVYDPSGDLVKTGRASGGQSWCSDLKRPCRTVQGTFRIYHKRGSDCVSNKFPIGEGGAPMPNCMFFHGGYAVHGSYHVPNYNASHGCIRVTPSASEWLDSYLGVGSTVIVQSY